jgi:hypothetical protein
VSLVEPRVPFTEIDELIFDSVEPVLIENLVNGTSKSFRVGVGQLLVVVEEDPRVVVLLVQRLEIFRVVREQDGAILGTPRYQFSVTGVLAEPIFRLFNVVTALPEQTLEDTTDVFVEQNPSARH